jgi:hypothetical protein
MYLPGDGRGMILSQIGNNTRLIATQNNREVKIFQLRGKTKKIQIPVGTIEAKALLKNGSYRQLTIHQGGGYMSSTQTQTIVDEQVKQIHCRLKGKETYSIIDVSF